MRDEEGRHWRMGLRSSFGQKLLDCPIGARMKLQLGLDLTGADEMEKA